MAWTEEEKELNADAIRAYGEHLAERLFLFAKSERAKLKAGGEIVIEHQEGCLVEKEGHCNCDSKFELYEHGVH